MTEQDKNASNISSPREVGIIEFWQKRKIFEKTLDKESPKGEFVFYDGPPFANGLPHYGHMLASVIKDVIPRFKTMQGYHVYRRWGWDCHGLPVENQVEKDLGLKNKKDIESYGIAEFNREAKRSVMSFADEWRKQIQRIGRWVDMKNDYRTMDTYYTESIWWAFKELHKKDLVYEGFKSMHICPRCETTLSNFEVSQGYKDIRDVSVSVLFELVEDSGTFMIAWTTTPWTLPGNVALAVNSEMDYVKIRVTAVKGGHAARLGDSGKYFITAKNRLAEIMKGYECEIVDNFKGKSLIGKNYVPPFDYYFKSDLKNRENGWKVYGAPFVNLEDGTGIVHIAPAFGEDDLNLSIERELPFIQHVSADGRFKPEVKDFSLFKVKPKGNPQEADAEVVKYLEKKNLLVSKEEITHSYPHCWRCDTPLLNYASSSWFVKVTGIRDKLINANKETKWTPEEMKEGRFGKWLESARDWAISRSRFWGAPIPVWKCQNCARSEFIGSVADLKTYTRSSNRYLILRHGEAENNTRGIISADPKQPHHLTEKGKEQVERAIESLKKCGVDLIYASLFVRTKETSEMVRTSLKILPQYSFSDERIGEIKAGEFDGKPVSAYQDYFSSTEERFTKSPAGGENYSDIRKRVMDFLYDVDRRFSGKTILIITHDAPAWVMMAGAEGLSIRESSALRGLDECFIRNGEIKESSFFRLPHDAEYNIDLHRPYIDEIILDCKCGGKLKRITDVFDCWFESGSMPYGQWHYPFQNLQHFNPKPGLLKKSVGFPADFIGEGVDQTRGWFYSMLVLSVALFGQAAYRRVLVTGIVLAEDGQKMSKKLNNYPDPSIIIDRYGADSLRYYLLSSPVVRAEDIRFCERDVAEVMSKVINRLDNVLSFYLLHAKSENKSLSDESRPKHVLDRWIVARLNELVRDVTDGLEDYQLDRASRPLGKFIEDLSIWYLRRSRERIKIDNDGGRMAVITMRKTLQTLARLMAPFMPFAAEHIYKGVGGEKESVHLDDWPETGEIDTDLLAGMSLIRSYASMALMRRAEQKIKVRQPLLKLSVKHKGKEIKHWDELKEILKDEINVKDIILDSTMGQNEPPFKLDTNITPELKREGDLRELVRAIQDLRKKKKLQPGMMATLKIEAVGEGRNFIESCKRELMSATSLDGILFESLEKEETIVVSSYSYKMEIK